MMKKLRDYTFILVILIVLLILNVILVHFEKQTGTSGITTIGSAIWYMAVTLTTVGYGDLYPSSKVGKLIGYIYVFSSLGVLGYLFSTISNKIFKIMEEKKLGFKGTNFEKHILIIGWNEFSKMVAEEIAATAKDMAIITNQRDDIDLIYNQFGKTHTFVLFSDYHNYEGLQKVNAAKASVAFISLEDDSEALMYVLDFRKSYPDPAIVVSLQKPRLKETFHAAGVTYAVARSEIASKLVASYIFEPDVAAMNLDLLSTSRTDYDHDIQEFQVRDNNPYVGKNCLDVFMDLKKKYNSILLGIYKNKESKIITNPADDQLISSGDYLVILASGYDKRKIQGDFSVSEGRALKNKG